MQSDQSSEYSGVFALYSAVLLMSLTGLFSKVIPLNAVFITQHRSVIGAVIFLGFFLWQRKSVRLSSVKEYLGVWCLGVLMGLHWVTYFHAMQVSTVAVGMLALFSYPVITVLVEPLFQGGRPKVKDMLAALVVFVGIIVMVADQLFAGQEGLSQGNILLGAFWGVASAVFMTLRNTIQKYRFAQVSSSGLMFHQVLTISVMLLPFVDFGPVTELGWHPLLMLFLLGLLPTVIGHTLMTQSLKVMPAKSVAIISCVQPLLGGLLAWAVLDEVPTVWVIAGGAVILAVAIYESVNKGR